MLIKLIQIVNKYRVENLANYKDELYIPTLKVRNFYSNTIQFFLKNKSWKFNFSTLRYKFIYSHDDSSESSPAQNLYL